MNKGKTVFAQLLGFVLFAHFEHLVDCYNSNNWTKRFTAWSHFICMSYAQFTRREGFKITLRNFMHLIEVNMFEKVSLQQMIANALEGDTITSQDRQQELFRM